MADFNPAVIGSIGANFDPSAGKTRAYQLKDLIDQEQLQSLQLSQAKQADDEKQKAKKILSTVDLSDPKNFTLAAQKLNAAGLTGPAMDTLRLGQEQQKEATSQQMSQAQLLGYVSDQMGPGFMQLKQILQTQGLPAAQQAYAQLHQQWSSVLPQLSKGPSQLPNDPAQAMQYIDGNIQKSQQARQIQAQQLADRRQADADKRTSIADRREATYEESVASQNKARDQKATASQSMLMDQEDLDFAAGQYLAGDKSVFQGLGRGTQGAANIVGLRKAIDRIARERGMSPGDVAAKQAEFSAIMAEERKIGGIAGGVEFAESELGKFIPLALQASDAVPRGTFVPFNKLIQMGQNNISDPALRKLYVNTQGVLNAYDVLAGRGGTDIAKREHNRQMLITADSPQVYKAALQAMQQEINVARGAGQEAKANVASELSGPQPAPAAAPAAPAAAPPAAPAAAPAQGKVIHWNDLP